MNIYILVWSFIVPHTENTYIEIPKTFRSLEQCISELADMRAYMDEGYGQCIASKVSK